MKKMLLIEDDDLVANMLSLMLSKSEFEVAHASTEQEAVAKFSEAQNSRKPFDLVVVDLILGEDNQAGAKAMKRIRAIQPGVVSILCTGFVQSPVVENFNEHGFDFCLSKPFSWQNLKVILAEKFEIQPPQLGKPNN